MILEGCLGTVEINQEDEVIMILLSITLLVVLLLNVLYVIREKHLRRVSEAKLEIVKSVSEIEQMMLVRKLCIGDLCHDKFHERMLATQYAGHFGIKWR